MASGANTYVPFSKRLPVLPSVVLQWPVILAAMLTMLTAYIVNRQLDNYPQGAPLHHDLTYPVLALQLAHDARDLRVTLAPPVAVNGPTSVPEMFRSSVHWDFAFILSYTTFFVLSMRMITWTSGMWPIALAAGLLDVAENVLQIQILDTAPDRIPDVLAAAERTVSLGKWTCIALVLLLAGWALTRVELKPFARPGTGLLAIAMILAGLVGLSGVVPEFPWPPGWFTNRHIELMTISSTIFPLVVLLAGTYGKVRGSRSGAASSVR